MLDLSLRDLEYVATIARERNITQAAARLHMAQPALSQSLQRIERRLGVRLFDRTSRRVEATAAGAELAAAADAILAEVALAVERTRTAGGLPGVLRVHVSDPSLVTPRRVLAAARAELPDVAVHQTTLPQEEVARRLLDGDLHLAIGGRFRRAGLASLRIGEERVGALVGREHPLAARERVTPEDVAAYPMLSVDEAMSAWNSWVRRYLGGHGLEPRWTKEVVFGLSTGSDVLHDQETVLLALESVSRDDAEGLVWRPMTPELTVPWFITSSDDVRRDNPAVGAVLRVAQRQASAPEARNG